MMEEIWHTESRQYKDRKILLNTSTPHRLPENNVADIIARNAREEPALVGESLSMSYADMHRHIAGARRWLNSQGIESGDRVALSFPNVAHMPILYYAALSLGAVVVPLNPLLSAREVNFHVSDSGAKLLVAWQGSRIAQEKEQLPKDLVQTFFIGSQMPWGLDVDTWEPEPVDLADPAVILYTSGTSGQPKGAVLTHKNLRSNALTVCEVFGYRAEDVFFGGLPLFHSFGQTVSMNAVFAAGATIALLPRFSAEAAASLCESAGVTVIAAVPSMYAALAAHLENRETSSVYGSIRFGISGGSPLPGSTHREFDRLLACPVYEGYGLSETSPVVSFNQEQFGLVVGSVGRAIPGVQLEIRDETGQVLPAHQPGQLWVRGDNVMAGYWNNPAATKAAFDGQWFATGDIARIDEQGNVFIVDRIKDMILRNGYSVYPREIEDVIHTHPGVRQVAVVGKPSDRVGEEVCAVLVPKTELDLTGQEKLVSELDALCRRELAAYKYPRHFKIVSELPLGPTGKILKREL